MCKLQDALLSKTGLDYSKRASCMHMFLYEVLDKHRHPLRDREVKRRGVLALRPGIDGTLIHVVEDAPPKPLGGLSNCLALNVSYGKNYYYYYYYLYLLLLLLLLLQLTTNY